MECPLCGAHNSKDLSSCHVCDNALSPLNSTQTETIILPTESNASLKINKSKLALILVLFTLATLPWYLMSDLLTQSQQVATITKKYHETLESYLNSKEQWLQQKTQILQQIRNQHLSSDLNKETLFFNSVPLEVFLAYIDDDLGFTEEQMYSTVLYPISLTPHPTFLLAKQEQHPWPFTISLATTVHLKNDADQRIVCELGPLTRGTRSLPSSYAWIYFTKELQLFTQLQEYSGGVKNIQIQELKANKSSSFELSWEYLHSQINNPFI